MNQLYNYSPLLDNEAAAPVAPFQTTAPSIAGWFSAVGDAIAMQPIWQAVSQTYEFFNEDYVAEPDFDPFAEENIKGFDNYLSRFVGVQSRREMDAVKARIVENEERRANISSELGLGGLLLSELANPINLIPLPGLVGVGVVKGALKGTTSFGALLSAEEVLRQGIDPTATLSESVDNVVYGSLFGTVIGGAAGAFARRGTAQLAEEFKAEFDRVQRAEDAPRGGEPIVKNPGKFEAKPTGEEDVGIANAFAGSEKWMGFGGLYKGLKATGIRAVADLADIFLGDFGTKSAQNRHGIPTEPGIDLGAGYWRARAGDALRQLEDIWTRAKHGGEKGGVRVGDVNLSVAKDRVMGMVGRAGGGGYMGFAEFSEAVFKAHKSGKIVTDDPFVKEGVKAVRQAMDEAMEAGVQSGLIRTKEGFQRAIQAKVNRTRQLIAKQEELLAKGDLTPNEELLLRQLAAAQQRTAGWFERVMAREIDDDGLAAFLDELDAEFAARRQSWADTARDIRKSGKKRRENTHAAYRFIDEMIERDRRILDYLNRQEAERGLTDKQRAYRDDLQRDLDSIDDGMEASLDLGGEGAVDAVPEEAFGKTLPDVLKWIAENGQDPLLRDLADNLRFMTEGVETIIYRGPDDRVGPRGSRALNRAYGAIVHNEGQARAFFNAKYAQGLSEETVVHEAIHAAIAIRFGNLKGVARSKIDGLEGEGKLYRQLDALRKIARKHAHEQLEKKGQWGGNMRTREMALIAFDNIDEFLTYGLTNPDFQAWLKTVPGREVAAETKQLTMWQELVEFVRKILGLNPKYDRGLEVILEAHPNMLYQMINLGNEMIDDLWQMPVVKQNPVEFSKAVKKSGWDLEPSARFADETNFLSQRQRDYLEVLEKRLAGLGDEYTGPKNDELYLTRYWKIDEVLADEAGPQELRRILTEWFTENPLPGARTDPDSIAKRVDDAIASITKQAEMAELQHFEPGARNAHFLSSRKLDIPNEKVFDFIETDVTMVLRSYMQRFGTMHEMTRRFGDTSANDAIEDAILQAALEVDATDIAKAEADLASLRGQLERARDHTTGAVYSMEPDKVASRRHAKWIRSYGTIMQLGGAALSSIPEAARGMMVHGFTRTIAATFDAVGNPAAAKRVTKAMRSRIAEGNDVVLGSSMQRFVDTGGPTGGSSNRMGRAMDRMSDFASGPYFIVNLLGPFTDKLKLMNTFWTQQFFIEDAIKFADTGDEKLAEMFASYGLSPEDVRAIAAEPAIAKEGRIFDPAIEDWADAQLAHRFQMAVSGMVRRIIPTAGGADVPEIAKGFLKGREFPLVTLPFQFMQYGFAAANKVLLSSLQGRDRSAMMGFMALFALGWLTEGIKTSDMYWDNMSVGEKAVRAFDRSGLVGIYSDIPTIVETATLGEVGPRRLLGMDPYVNNPDYFDAVGELGGPVVGTMADYARLMAMDDVEPHDVTGTVRRSLPFNSLFYVKGLFRDLDRGAASVLEGPAPVSD